jgi:hypothetical protein
MGDDPAVATGSIVRNDILIEFRGQSIDGDKLVRSVVRHYLVRDDDSVERVPPLALSPAGFIEEWLTGKWVDIVKWTDAAGDRDALEKSHRSLRRDDLFGEFDNPPTRCRTNPTLWQASFSTSLGSGKDFHQSEPAYFLVRWQAPYRFSLVKIQNRQFPNCDVKDEVPYNFGTLFPMQGWRR